MNEPLTPFYPQSARDTRWGAQAAAKKEAEARPAPALPSVAPSRRCPDCACAPGRPHEVGCDVERCSVCGGQRLGCGCAGHDRAFARWTGLWPGSAEAAALGMDLNELHLSGVARLLFTKPEIG